MPHLRSKRGRFLSFAALLAIVVAGLFAWTRYRAPATDHAIQLVPANARAYLHVFLKPSTQQRRALRSLLELFPETDEEEEAESFVDDVLRETLARVGLDVSRDAAEWLGNEAAIYLIPEQEDPVAVLAVDDDDRALEDLADAVPDGVQVEIVDDFVVIGSAAAIDASAAAADGESLAESRRYEVFKSELDPHHIASLFVQDLDLPSKLHRAVGLPPDPAAALSMGVTEDGVFVDVITSGLYTSLPITGYASVGPLGVKGAIDMPASLGQVLPEYVPGLSELPPAFNPIRADSRTGPAPIPAGPREAAEDRLDGYAPKLSVDLSALPPLIRNALADRLPAEYRRLILQVRTVDLGMKLRGALEWDRLVVTFGDG